MGPDNAQRVEPDTGLQEQALYSEVVQSKDKTSHVSLYFTRIYFVGMGGCFEARAEDVRG